MTDHPQEPRLDDRPLQGESPLPEDGFEHPQQSQSGMSFFQQVGVLFVGLLIIGAAVIGIWITWGSGASVLGLKSFTPQGRAMPEALRSESFPPCPTVPATFLGGQNDGRFPLLNDVSGLIAADIASFGVVGRESAAEGRNRDAEVAYLMSCRVATELNGPASLESADARYQLANHYARTAVNQNPPSANQHELMRRAEELYASSAKIYAANFGEDSEKSKFAAQGLAGVQQRLVEAGVEPAQQPGSQQPGSDTQVAKAPSTEPATPTTAQRSQPPVVADAPARATGPASAANPRAAAPASPPAAAPSSQTSNASASASTAAAAATAASARATPAAGRTAGPARPAEPALRGPAVAAASPSAPAPARPSPSPSPSSQRSPVAAAPAPLPAPLPAPRPAARVPPPVAPQPPAQEAAPVPAPASAPAPQPPSPPPTPAASPRPAAEPPAPRVEVAKVQPAEPAEPRAVPIRPSFDCSKARSVAEKLICSDEQLARIDRDLGRTYARARNAATDQAAFRRQQDSEWLKRENTCRDRTCLLRWYSARQAQLTDVIENGGPRQDAEPGWNNSSTGRVMDMGR